MMIDMDMEYRFGLMGLNMKANGSIIKLKVKGHFGMLKEMSMMENLKMIKQMVMAYILM